MRLTVNLEPDLYGVAKSLSREEDCSVSTAVNRLLRRALTSPAPHLQAGSNKPRMRNGFAIAHGSRPVTADLVRKLEAADDKS